MSTNHNQQSAEEFHRREFPQWQVCLCLNIYHFFPKPSDNGHISMHVLSLQCQEHGVDVHAHENGFLLSGFTASHGRSDRKPYTPTQRHEHQR